MLRYAQCQELSPTQENLVIAAERPTILDQRWFNNEVSEAGNAAGFQLTHLNLFSMPNVANIEEYLLGQDVVWVNGGSVVNLLAVWRAHGLGSIFRRVREAGVVLAGVSAARTDWALGAPAHPPGAVRGPGDPAP